MMEHIKAQLKRFRAEDDAQWRYESDEMKRQNKIFDAYGNSDKKHQSVLEKAGLNVRIFEKESKDSVKDMRKAHKEMLAIVPPPERAHCKDQLTLNYLASFHPEIAWPWYRCDMFYPPIHDAWGDSEECGTNLALGEFNIAEHSTGDGWGWAARAYPWHYCTMWYIYFPPIAGDITIEPHVDFQGNVAITAHDHAYTSTVAKLKVHLLFDLYQHYWDGEQKAVIIDEHHRNSNTAYWVNQHRVMSKSLSASANDPIYIKLTVAYQVIAHSSHAMVDFDFRTGAERRIRLEHIRICRPVPPEVKL